MILYAVKTNGKYLHRRPDGTIDIVSLEKASVYPDINKAADAKELFGGGKIVKLVFTEEEAES